MDSLVNYLNSFYAVKTKPFYFKTTKYLFLKSLVPLKTSVCIKSSVSGTVSNGVGLH